MVDASERLQALLTQEDANYRTTDYLTRMQMGENPLENDNATPTKLDGSSPTKKRKSWSSLEDAAQQGAESTCGSDGSSTSQINKHWREKICAWAYQGKYWQERLRALHLSMIHI